MASVDVRRIWQVHPVASREDVDEMTLDELRASIARSREQGVDRVVVTLKRERPRGKRVRIAQGLMGDIVGSHVDGRIIVSVPVDALEGWMAKVESSGAVG